VCIPWLLLASPEVEKPVIREVHFRGLADQGQLSSPFEVGESLTPRLLENGIRNVARQLSALGYLQAEVSVDTTMTGQQVTLALDVVPGETAVLGQWRVEGDIAGNEGGFRPLLHATGRPATHYELQRSVQSVRAAYAARGYVSARVWLNTVSIQEGIVTPTLRTEKGAPARLSFLAFTGSDLSRLVLSKSAGFRPGMVCSDGLADMLGLALERSGLVHVRSRRLVRSGKRYGIEYTVERRRNSDVQVAIGYFPSSEEWSGHAALSTNSLLGTGRRLLGSWQSMGGETRYEIGYTEPWLFGSWFDLVVGAWHRAVDSSGSQTRAGIALWYDAGQELAFGIESSVEWTVAADSATNARTVWATTGVGIDTRNSRDWPTRGYAVSAKTSAGQRTRLAGRSFVGSAEVDLEQHGPGLGRLGLYNALHGRALLAGDSLAEAELHRIGGAGSVRGYSEASLAGGQVAWSNTELRFRVGEQLSAYPFVDIGLVHSSGGWMLRPGYGLGVGIRTNLGVLSLDYGLGRWSAPLEGLLHLSLSAAF